MVATLLFREKYVYADGGIREMILWRLPEPTVERPHGLKYRMYYGLADGTCVVRYYNERGKGDHVHHGTQELPYHFVDAERLIADFLSDIQEHRGGAP